MPERPPVERASLAAEIRQSRPFPSAEQEAAVSLLRTTDIVRRRMSELIEPYGVTIQQYNVLRILRGSHPDRLPTLEIVQRMVEQAPGITRLLDRLESKQLVARERCRVDRRQVLCAITPAGIELLARLDGPITEAARLLFGALGAQGIASLLEAHARVRDAAREPLGLPPCQPAQPRPGEPTISPSPPLSPDP